MDRTVTVQVIAMLVVLNALVRWLPDDDPRDPLGLGQPWDAVRLDEQLQQVGVDSDDARTLLRLLSRPAREQQAYRSHWERMQGRALSIREAALKPGAEPPFVQFKGIPRNDLWCLMYLLYPIEHTFETWEDGSRVDDETLEGAQVIKTKIVPWNELPQDLWPDKDEKVKAQVPEFEPLEADR